MNNDEHVLILVAGKTGSGKSSLINKLCERANLKPLISQTTRLRRNEADNDHNFVTEEEYFKARENGEVAVDAEIAGNYYYSTIEQLYGSDLYTLNPEAIKKLKTLDLPNIRYVTVYISCPDTLREDRVVKQRGDDKFTFRKRSLDEAPQFREMLRNEDFDYVISNIDFAKAYSCLRHISNIEGVWKNNNTE